MRSASCWAYWSSKALPLVSGLCHSSSLILGANDAALARVRDGAAAGVAPEAPLGDADGVATGVGNTLCAVEVDGAEGAGSGPKGVFP